MGGKYKKFLEYPKLEGSEFIPGSKPGDAMHYKQIEIEMKRHDELKDNKLHYWQIQDYVADLVNKNSTFRRIICYKFAQLYRIAVSQHLKKIFSGARYNSEGNMNLEFYMTCVRYLLELGASGLHSIIILCSPFHFTTDPATKKQSLTMPKDGWDICGMGNWILCAAVHFSPSSMSPEDRWKKIYDSPEKEEEDIMTDKTKHIFFSLSNIDRVLDSWKNVVYYINKSVPMDYLMKIGLEIDLETAYNKMKSAGIQEKTKIFAETIYFQVNSSLDKMSPHRANFIKCVIVGNLPTKLQEELFMKTLSSS